MSRLRPTTDIRPLADFRANLAAVVEQVQRTKRPVVLTQHGRSAAVLMDAEVFEAMQDRLDMFEDVRLAEEQLARGEGMAHGKAKAAVLARLRP
jgi:prevent-host-death family protein